MAARDRLAKHITSLPNGQRVNTLTGEILGSPANEAISRLRNVRFKRNKEEQPGSFSRPAPKKSKESGRDIARRATLGDPFNEDISKRPKGNAKMRYMTDYVMKDRIRSANRRAGKYTDDRGALPTTGKEYNKEVRRMILDFKARFPNMDISEANLMHINPLAQGGKNRWSNLRLGPAGLNIDQATAHPSAYRQLPASEAVRFGAAGQGVGEYWEGIPDAGSPRPEFDPATGRRKPVGPKGPGLKGLGAFSLALGPIAAVAQLAAAKKNNKPFSFDDFMGALLGTGNINQRPQGPMG